MRTDRELPRAREESFRDDFVILKSKSINPEHQNMANEVDYQLQVRICSKSELWVLSWSNRCHRSVLARRNGSLGPSWRDRGAESSLDRLVLVVCIDYF